MTKNSTKDEREALLYAEESLVLETLERICEWMNDENISRAGLARLLDRTPQYVTKVLRGENITLRTLAKIVHVMGGTVDVRLAPLRRARAPRAHGPLVLVESSKKPWDVNQRHQFRAHSYVQQARPKMSTAAAGAEAVA